MVSYSKSATTRIAQCFLHLDIHFSKNHTFSKIFNKNNFKVSCSCMLNIKAIINNHNMNILHQNNEIKDEYNCRNNNFNPTQLQRPSLELQKSRFYNHTKFFTHEDYANDTEFSKEYWEIKSNLEHLIYVCMYVCMYVRTYVCMYVCINILRFV